MQSFIIRSVGERTTMFLENQIRSYFPGSEIIIIKESPFTAALTSTYTIGKEMKGDWISVLDADVIIDISGFKKLLEKAKSQPSQVFEVQGIVLDKMFGKFRPAGVHIYNKKHFDRAVEFVPKKEESLRPESFVMRKMAAEGFPFVQTNIISGLHDFEQFYKDVYRTGFIHGKKHLAYESELTTFWNSTTDPDYQVALIGFNAGKSDKEINFVTNEIDESPLLQYFSDAKIEEKSADVSLTKIDIETIIKNHLNLVDRISYNLIKTKFTYK